MGDNERRSFVPKYHIVDKRIELAEDSPLGARCDVLGAMTQCLEEPKSRLGLNTAPSHAAASLHASYLPR
jgi:hypothetical protein